jgi:hypothetical protein
MKKTTSTLNYDFYFLFDRKDDYFDTINKSNENCEPNKPLLHVKVDNGSKDLFIWNQEQSESDSSFSPPLEEWKSHLQHGWLKILQFYFNLFQEDKKSNHNLLISKIKSFCKDNFIGIALVIMDTTIDEHQIELTTNTNKSLIFTRSDKPSQHTLFKIIDNQNKKIETILPPDVLFEEYKLKSRYDSYQIKIFPSDKITPQLFEKNCKIELTSHNDYPQLIPMKIGEEEANPIFAVYALEHGNIEEYNPDLAGPLQNMLCRKEEGIFINIIPQLILLKWQFARMINEARQRLDILDEEKKRYQDLSGDLLKCMPNNKLKSGLVEIEWLNADTIQIISRINIGIRTLGVSYKKIEKYSQISSEEIKKLNLKIQWKSGNNSYLFDMINRLRIQRDYLYDSLTYVKGIQSIWKINLETNSIEISKKLKNIASILALLVAVREIFSISIKNGGSKLDNFFYWIKKSFFFRELTDILQSQNLYILIIFFFIIVPIIYIFLSSFVKRIKFLFFCYKNKQAIDRKEKTNVF